MLKRKSILKGNEPFWIGLFGIGIICIAAIILCQNTYISPHDQFDGEVFTYILRAKHFGSNAAYPEIMNGLPPTGLQLASPATQLFYLLFSPVNAFMINLSFILLTAYSGMYLILNQQKVSSLISTIISVCFAFLPFYSVYGMTIMGVPLYLYAIGYLKKAKKKEELFLSYGLIILYGCFSSLVLAGFAVLFLSGVYLLYLILKKQTRSSAPKIAGGCFILASVYAMNNVELIEQVLGLEGETSHKVEMVLSPEPFTLHEFLSLFIKGQYHAASKHIFLLCVIFVVLAVALWRYKTLEYIEKKWFLGITKAVLGAAGIALFYCIFHCPMVVNWRNQLPGALKAFQLDRFYWLYPAIWFISAGLAIDLGWRLCRKFAFKIAFVGMVGCALLGTLWMCRENVLIKDMLKIISPNIIGQRLDKNNVTWKGFFAEDVFQQIENDIDPDKQSYRVISIGMYPTIPLYNGFYCLDGYSNNYPLEYKHQFYEIIKEELECDESLKKYFCEWGSRCYAFTHEVGMEYMTPKGSSTKITDLKLNLEAFSGMGGRYIFSAVEIEAHQKYGLDFIGNYVAKDSYYQIWVYEYPV